MADRVLNLKATINKTTVTIELVDINRIKPFRLYIPEYQGSGRNTGNQLFFSVRNGAINGRGVSVIGRRSFSLIVYNGNYIKERQQRVGIPSDSGHPTTTPGFIRNRLLVLRKSLEKYFENVDINFKFTIIDRTGEMKESRHVIAEMLSPGILQLESLEANKPVTRLTAYKEFSVENKSACLVHDKRLVIILLHKVSSTKVHTLLDSFKYTDKACVWIFPVLDETGTPYSGIVDLSFIVKKSDKSKGEKKYFDIDVVANKLIGGGVQKGSLSNNFYTGITIWNPDRSYSSRLGIDSSKPTLFITPTTKTIMLPSFPVGLRNATFVRKKPTSNMLSPEGTCNSLSMKQIVETFKLWDQQLNRLTKSSEYNNNIIKYKSNVIINGIEMETSNFCTSRNNTGTITITRFASKENTRFKIKGFFNIAEEDLDVITGCQVWSTSELIQAGFNVDLNAKKTKIDENNFCINLGKQSRTTFDVEFETDNYSQVFEQFSQVWDEIVWQVGGGIEISVHEYEDLSLPPTKRCTPFDFKFSVGVEYETGIGNIQVQTTEGYHPTSKNGQVYGYCQDGGGVELKTVVMDDPNIFSYIGKFDALCKSIRSSGFRPKTSASTHIHMSINPRKKIDPIPKGKKTQEVNPTWYGTALFRRTLIGNNWFALLNKYLLALSFFDGFNPGGRRQTGYGLGFLIHEDKKTKEKTVIFKDARFTRLKGKQYKEVCGALHRDSLLRNDMTNAKTKGYLHWEWRGTDACPSALFMGLKIEFMQAIAREAIQQALDGVQLDPWDETVMGQLDDIVKVESVYDIVDSVCRKKALLACKELQAWMTPYAYKGLRAWATYVNHLDESTGTVKWFEKMEKILVTKIGPKMFVTKEDLNNIFALKKTSKCYVPIIPKADKEEDKEKAKNYPVVVTSDMLTTTATGYGYGGACGPQTKACYKCGAMTNVTVGKFKTRLCNTCYEEEAKLERWELPKAKEYTPPPNQTDATKSLINEIVTRALSID